LAFTSTITETVVMGNKRMSYGTFTNTSGDTGGEVDTGLSKVDIMFTQTTGAVVPAQSSSINETLPLHNTSATSTVSVTLVTVADNVGFWVAYGI
jgi:hypothetical protein